MEPVLKWFLIVCIIILLLYKYGTRNFNYWKKQGVKQLPTIPFIGNDLFGSLSGKNFQEMIEINYKPFQGQRFGGLYVGQVPFLCITDADLLKQILVKDSDTFFNRHGWFANIDALMDKSLFSLADDNWKKVRTVMTTVFTSAKMKDMYGFMEKCARQSVEHLEGKVREHSKSQRSGKPVYELEWKDFFCRYGCDVIGSTAFGFEVDSFKNPENEFFMTGLVIKDMFKGWTAIKMFLIMSLPRLSHMLGLQLFGKKYNDYFISLVNDTIRQREEKNIVRKDVIHILMEAKKGKGLNENGEIVKGKLPDITVADMAAQTFAFFLGGFETVATLLGFIAYELAVNPDVQETLQREIDEVYDRENGFTYDGIIHHMPYLNMVVNETLRKWPPAQMTDRDVNKTYRIPKTDDSPEVVLEKGTSILVPIAGLHYNPEYFPNPHKFDPERFRDEKNTIKPFTYLPFGEGIRHCIGMRYALLEAKTIIIHILKKFTLVPGPKTDIPIKLAKTGAITIMSENGFWLGVKPRQ